MTKLEEAEMILRATDNRMYSLTSVERKAIADELDRLRAELAAFNGDMVEIACGNCLKHDANGFVDCDDAELPVNQWCVSCLNRDARSAAAGLDERRLRVKLEQELAALKGEAECIRWTPGETADGCIDDTFYKTREAAEEAGKGFGFPHVFAVLLSARKVAP